MTITSNHYIIASCKTLLPTPEKITRFNMGFASKTPSLPFTVRKSSANLYIPFAEFEAAFLAKYGGNGENETKTVHPGQSSLDLSASKRAWNLMSLFPRANTTAAATCESRAQMEFTLARLDRMHEIEDDSVEKLASGMESPSEDPKRPINFSSHLSAGEGSMDVPSITTSTTSSAHFSCNSCTQSDIVNAVERVRSEEGTVSSMKLSPSNMKGSYNSTGNPEAKIIESPELSSSSVLAEMTPIGLDTSKSHNDEAPVQEKVPSIRNNGENLIPRVEKSAEQEMAELILRRKRLLARKKTKNPTSS